MAILSEGPDEPRLPKRMIDGGGNTWQVELQDRIWRISWGDEIYLAAERKRVLLRTLK